MSTLMVCAAFLYQYQLYNSKQVVIPAEKVLLTEAEFSTIKGELLYLLQTCQEFI